MVNVRVRGIYATALTRLLVEKGYAIVQPSEKIAVRFGLTVNNSPSDVTIKDSDDGDGVILIGSPAETREVFEQLTSTIPFTFKTLSKAELYSVYLVRIEKAENGVCTADAGEFKVEVSPCKETPGDKAVVGVRKAPLYPGERVIASKGFRLLGKLVALLHGEPRVTFSEHIRDPELKARLTTLAASRLMGTGLGIHFRSSARFAGSGELLNEIDMLLGEYRRLMARVKEAEPPVKLYSGELLGFIRFTSLSKAFLDYVRDAVTPTISGHHSLRSMGLGDLVEALEFSVMHGCGRDAASKGVHEFLLAKISEERSIRIKHVKPTGEVLELVPGRVEKVLRGPDSTRIIIKRLITGSGIYDGLNVERKPGDVDYMVIMLGRPYIVHNYYRGNTWLGSYINVNTPPEVSADTVKYHDLLVDVSVTPDGRINVLDREELDKAFQQGLIDSRLYQYALKAVEEAVGNPAPYLYNPSHVIQ